MIGIPIRKFNAWVSKVLTVGCGYILLIILSVFFFVTWAVSSCGVESGCTYFVITNGMFLILWILFTGWILLSYVKFRD